VAPDSFDFGRKLWFDGIRAQGFTLHPIDRLPASATPTTYEAFSAGIQQWRDIVSERIRESMSERTGPLAVAFLTGERGGIQKADNQAMRDSSLAHLLSISGIHMMLAGFGFFSALRLALAMVPACASDPRTRKWAAAAALVVSTAYLVLSGASVPTQRAFVTIAVSLLAIMCDRSALSLRTVALAATSILVVTPEAWIDPSFQMSFSAVAALVAFHEWRSATSLRQAGTSGWLGWFTQLLFATAITSLIAGTATAPFAAFHFNRMTVYGVAANLLVTPVVSFMIMPAGVLALMLLPLGLEAIPLAVMQQGLEIMLRIAAWVATWPGAVIPLASFPVSALVAMSLGGIWIVIWQARWRWLGALPLAIGMGIALLSTPPDVIISNSGHNVAVRGSDGKLGFLSARRDRFDAGMWLSASGDARDLSEALKDKSRAFDCSADHCLSLTETRHWVAVAQEPGAAVLACRYADVLVLSAEEGVSGCGPSTLVFDKSTLAREGAISIWLRGPTPIWTSVKRERGRRLWAPAAENDDQMDQEAQ
jgi:competence protein ComEC